MGTLKANMTETRFAYMLTIVAAYIILVLTSFLLT